MGDNPSWEGECALSKIKLGSPSSSIFLTSRALLFQPLRKQYINRNKLLVQILSASISSPFFQAYDCQCNQQFIILLARNEDIQLLTICLQWREKVENYYHTGNSNVAYREKYSENLQSTKVVFDSVLFFLVSRKGPWAHIRDQVLVATVQFFNSPTCTHSSA